MGEVETFQAQCRRKRFFIEVSEMPFPGLWGRFDRILKVRKQRYNMSKFTIWLEFSSTTVNGRRRI